jgi:anti-sigma28 factor (negative regulator of flagellin synthesis)
MSSINGLGAGNPIQQTQKVAAPNVPASPDVAAPKATATDRLELSGVSHLLQTLKTNGGVRLDKVAEIKSQIEAGTYDADGAKLDGALNGLMDDLGKE